MSEQLEFDFSIVNSKMPNENEVAKVISFNSHKLKIEKQQQESLLKMIIEAAKKNPLYK